jgi:hypothetical protein
MTLEEAEKQFTLEYRTTTCQVPKLLVHPHLPCSGIQKWGNSPSLGEDGRVPHLFGRGFSLSIRLLFSVVGQ